MPQRKCAAKRLRVDKTKARHNSQIKSELKKELKSLRSLLATKKLEEAKEQLKKVFSRLDRAAAKGLIHKNTASRRKSNLSLTLKKTAQ